MAIFIPKECILQIAAPVFTLATVSNATEGQIKNKIIKTITKIGQCVLPIFYLFFVTRRDIEEDFFLRHFELRKALWLGCIAHFFIVSAIVVLPQLLVSGAILLAKKIRFYKIESFLKIVDKLMSCAIKFLNISLILSGTLLAISTGNLPLICIYSLLLLINLISNLKSLFLYYNKIAEKLNLPQIHGSITFSRGAERI